MKRINIIGTTGSGKSTLALTLSEKLGYPYVQMDQLFWKPDWQETSDEELFPKLTEVLSEEVWILDGNYNRTNQLKWKRADTIVWIDLGYFRTFFQLFKRTLIRAVSQQELWPGTGNKESLYKSFMSRDSILVWFFRYYHINQKRYSKLMQSTENSHIEMIHLKSPSQIRKFIKQAHHQSLESTSGPLDDFGKA